MTRKPTNRDRRVTLISRQDAETLCLLRVIGTGEQTIRDICRALGVSASHEPRFAKVMTALASQGQIKLVEDRASLSELGLEKMVSLGSKVGLEEPSVIQPKRKKRPTARRV